MKGVLTYAEYRQWIHELLEEVRRVEQDMSLMCLDLPFQDFGRFG